MFLYDKGFNDKNIFNVTGLNNQKVAKWRQDNNLPAQHEKRLIEIEDLYILGLPDSAIARVVKIKSSAVKRWREKYELPVNPDTRRITKDSKKDLKALYDSGYSDVEMSRESGRSVDEVAYWRYKYGLPSNGRQGVSRPCSMDVELAFKLYNIGFSDLYIAEICGVNVGTVVRWRQFNSLLTNSRADNMRCIKLIEQDIIGSDVNRDVYTDPESLYHSTKTLEEFMGRKLNVY